MPGDQVRLDGFENSLPLWRYPYAFRHIHSQTAHFMGKAAPERRLHAQPADRFNASRGALMLPGQGPVFISQALKRVNWAT